MLIVELWRSEQRIYIQVGKKLGHLYMILKDLTLLETPPVYYDVHDLQHLLGDLWKPKDQWPKNALISSVN